MGDYNISIVPSRSVFPGKEQKAREILDWLIGENIVSATLSDCILSEDETGYAIADGARSILEDLSFEPFGLLTNGMEIILERTVFYRNDLDKVSCPSCKTYIGSLEDGAHVLLWLDEWHSEAKYNFECPSCGKTFDLNDYIFQPQWGFSDLGFTFWNWGNLKDSFIAKFAERLGCPVKVVHTKL